MKIINELKIFLYGLIPSVHNLQQVIYIRWMDRDWYIRKDQNRNFVGYFIISTFIDVNATKLIYNTNKIY